MSDHKPDPAIYRHMFRGSFWAVAMRWSIRGIGFVSVIILARLLSPADFGVMSMGALVIGFITGFSELGIQMLLIRERDIGPEHCNTAWTLKIIQGGLVGLVLILLSPLAAEYFDEPKVVPVMYVLALNAAIAGFDNIGMVLARRDLLFALDFRFNVYQKIVSFFATIALAWYLRSYWALVIGQSVATLGSLLLSYRMHPYRPKFSLARVRDYVRFGAAMVPLNVGKYLNDKVDVVVVGGASSTSLLGAYNVASEVSFMATKEIVLPIARGLLPTYAKLTHEPRHLAIAYLNVLATVASIVIPVGAGLWATADAFVGVVLGAQWDAAVPLLRWLAVYCMLGALIHLLTGQILIVSGHERSSAVLMWVRLAILVPACVLAAQQWGAVGVAAAATGSAALMVPIAVGGLLKAIPARVVDVVAALWRPAVAALAMALIVDWFDPGELGSPLLLLAADVGVGVIVYATGLLLLWRLAGRPAGPERLVVDALAAKLRHRSSPQKPLQ